MSRAYVNCLLDNLANPFTGHYFELLQTANPIIYATDARQLLETPTPNPTPFDIKLFGMVNTRGATLR